MAFATTCSCDFSGCKEIKRETNHWYWAVKLTTGIIVGDWEESIQVYEVTYDHSCASAVHLCGRQHLLSWISEVLGDSEHEPAAHVPNV